MGFRLENLKGRAIIVEKKGHRAKECNKKKADVENGTEKVQDGTCPYCKIGKHEESKCWKKAFDDRQKRPEVGMFSVGLTSSDELKGSEWIIDSGATCHMCNDANVMFDLINYESEVAVGNGEVQKVKEFGKSLLNNSFFTS